MDFISPPMNTPASGDTVMLDAPAISLPEKYLSFSKTTLHSTDSWTVWFASITSAARLCRVQAYLATDKTPAAQDDSTRYTDACLLHRLRETISPKLQALVEPQVLDNTTTAQYITFLRGILRIDATTRPLAVQRAFEYAVPDNYTNTNDWLVAYRNAAIQAIHTASLTTPDSVSIRLLAYLEKADPELFHRYRSDWNRTVKVPDYEDMIYQAMSRNPPPSDPRVTALTALDKPKPHFTNGHGKPYKGKSDRSGPPASKPATPTTPCPHCNGGRHWKSKCYYLHPELRPDGWLPSKNDIKCVDPPKMTPNTHISCIATGLSAKPTLQSHTWVIDTGASMHLCTDRGKFTSYEPVDLQIRGLSGLTDALGKGSVEINVQTASGVVTLLLREAYHVPGLPYNLFSTSSARNSLWFDTKLRALRRWSDDSVLVKTTLYDGLYCLTALPSPKKASDLKLIEEARL
jgi:hypothetical protein